MSVFNFTGKCAVVTGGASGIGLECVKALSACGAEVIIADLNVKAAEDASLNAPGPGKVFARGLDVTDHAACAAMVAELETIRPIDLLVTSAGAVAPESKGALPEISAVEKMLRINLLGTFNVVRPVAEHMRARRRGAIVTVGSVASHVIIPERTAYCISKHALKAMTAGVAEVLAGDGVRINQVDPGRVMTELVVKWLEGADDRAEAFRRGAATQSTGVMLWPEAVANAVLYLLSDLAESLQGSFLDLSGGWKQGHLPFNQGEMPPAFDVFRKEAETRHGLDLGSE